MFWQPRRRAINEYCQTQRLVCGGRFGSGHYSLHSPSIRVHPCMVLYHQRPLCFKMGHLSYTGIRAAAKFLARRRGGA